MDRGTLRIYLGAAPGVGKSYAMLNEGRRRAGRGRDVVVGFLEDHGRRLTAAQADGLEIVPRRRFRHDGVELEEMDVDAVLARRPEVALVDELAHRNAAGARNETRWQDVEELLAAGIDVISTLNIQHLESLNDVVARITGVAPAETVPDEVVRRAEQVELVDMTPEALRRRLAHGNVYAAEQIDAAIGNYFRVGNLAALRELALLWVADRVDETLQSYRQRHGIEEPWETRERVLVALTGAPGGDQLIRRAARMAMRGHSELVGVHVRTAPGLTPPSVPLLAEHRALVEQLGGRFLQVDGSDVATALLNAARAENASQLVLGASRRGRLGELLTGSVINRVLRAAGSVDVHIIGADDDRHAPVRLPARAGRVRLPGRRRAAGWALATVGPLALTGMLSGLRDHVGLPSVLLLFQLLVMAVAALGGAGPALLGALSGFLLANWYFTPPLHGLTVDRTEDLIALLAFLVVAAVVSWFVATLSRREAEAVRARAEATVLARGATGGAGDRVAWLLEQLVDTFSLAGASVLRPATSGWTVVARAGASADHPDPAAIVIPLPGGAVLAASATKLAAEDQDLLRVLAGQLGAAVEQRRLAEQAAATAELARAGELRSALLAAVSHDLRTPLASIKASVTSLLEDDVDWKPEELAEFCQTIDEEADRLGVLIANLLDMSRLTADAVEVLFRPVGVEEIVAAALASLGQRARQHPITVEVPETLPRVLTDAALLERAVANLVANAIAWSPPGSPVRLEAGVVPGAIHLRVVDRGPGIPLHDRERVFEPFQRLGDSGTGVGLGLAVARGFVAALGGELDVEDTPGGGTTMLVSVPLAEEEP